MISVRMLFFGPAKDRAGIESVVLDVADGTTVDGLRQTIVERFSELRTSLSTMRLAVNCAFVDERTELRNNDEIAVIPPVSGGSGDPDILVELVEGPIDMDGTRSFIFGNPHLGGVVTFEGVTRSEVDAGHGALVRLDYEAYEAMAVSELDRLANEAKGRWGLGRVAIVHRLGSVPPGEVSVMICVAAAHRAEAFQACGWLIDTLKRNVPIWKKDVFADGFVKWVEPNDIKPRVPSA